MLKVAVVGSGRAGTAFAASLGAVGYDVVGPTRRGEDLATATRGSELVLLCVSDGAIADVAESLPQDFDGVVAHVAGSVGVEVLPNRFRRGALHPLVSIPPRSGPGLLLDPQATFAVEGDDAVRDVVNAFGGQMVEIDGAGRALYHAAACIASNHLVALMGQVERVANAAGLDLSIYLPLIAQTMANVAEMGPHDALTGPAARGDAVTISRHLEALDPSERDTYRALVTEAERLSRSEA